MRARARDGRVPPCPGGRQARRLRYVADGWRVSLWVFGFFEGRQALLGFVRPFNLKKYLWRLRRNPAIKNLPPAPSPESSPPEGARRLKRRLQAIPLRAGQPG